MRSRRRRKARRALQVSGAWREVNCGATALSLGAAPEFSHSSGRDELRMANVNKWTEESHATGYLAVARRNSAPCRGRGRSARLYPARCVEDSRSRLRRWPIAGPRSGSLPASGGACYRFFAGDARTRSPALRGRQAGRGTRTQSRSSAAAARLI